MKIRNRLYLMFSLFLVMFVLIGFTIFRANKKINRATELAGITSSIGENLNDLNMVTYEFLLYHEERMQQQWYVAYASVSKLLKERTEKPDSPEEAAILQSISRDIEAIHALFLKLIAIHDKRNMLSSGNEQEKKLPSLGPLDAMLASELLVKSHNATLGGLKLHAMAQKKILGTERKVDSVIIISMIVFMLVLLISGALTIRSIATPISKLVEGTYVIGNGDFDYTIKVKARDEIGELAASFNTMAQNLLAREQALRESETKYRSLTDDVLDSLEVGIFILDSDFNVVWINQSLERYFGLRWDVIIGKDKRQLIRNRIKDIFDDPESFVQKVFATYDNNTYVENFECHVLPDGERQERWLEHWSQPIWSGLYAGGRIEHYYDITKRKQAENHIQHLQSVLMAIRNVNQLIVHEKNQKKLLQRTCDILNRASEYKLMWIGLIEEDNKTVLPIAQAGFEEGYLTSLRITWDDSETGNGPTGTAIKTKKPSVMRDISADHRFKPWREEAIKRGYASSVALPLVYEERIFGALNVYAAVPDAFDEEEIDLLLEISRDIAFALHSIEIEQEIERTKEFLQNIIDNTSDLVCTVDLEGNFLSINKAVTEQLGYEEEDLIGKPKIKLAVDPELFMSTFKEVLDKGSLSNLEVPFRRKDGTIADILYSVSLLRDKEGNPVAVAGFGKDITERKQAQEELSKHREHLEELVKKRTADLSNINDQLQQEIIDRNRAEEAIQKQRDQLAAANRDLEEKTRELEAANIRLQELDRLKSMFIASMSHELRTPLNSIIGFTGIILQGLTGDINDEQRDQLQRAYGSAKHLLGLINDIIDISKIEAGKLEVQTEKFSLDGVIKEAVSNLTPEINKKGLDIETRAPQDIQLTTDRKRLLQCLLNYLSNAVKFIEKGKIRIVARERGKMVEIRVQDTGVGIREEDMSNLFISFVRLESPLKIRTPGTGLGLYLTKKITTELLEGTVSVESKYGKGSTFVLKIPKVLGKGGL